MVVNIIVVPIQTNGDKMSPAPNFSGRQAMSDASFEKDLSLGEVESCTSFHRMLCLTAALTLVN